MMGWLADRLDFLVFGRLYEKIEHNHQHLKRQEIHMSNLDDSTDALAVAYTDLADRLGNPTGELGEALARIQELNAQVADLQANAEDTAEREAELIAERDSLIDDAIENVGKISVVTDGLRQLGAGGTPATPGEPTGDTRPEGDVPLTSEDHPPVEPGTPDVTEGRGTDENGQNPGAPQV